MLVLDSPTPNPSGISVPVAIIIGLISSFVQSLGLTIQRKSHMQDAALPERQQRKEWRRKSWVAGFVIFIFANVGGTVFQIGALPIVMLAPLGAVSLLFNALLARFILDDFFSGYMIGGTALIVAGAVLIGYFGVVNEPPHSLDELLALFARPAFIAFASIFFVAFLGVLAIAHLAEWQLHVRLFQPSDPESAPRRKKVSHKRKKSMPRRWSAPTLAPVAEVSESSSGIATPSLEIADEASRRGIPVDRLLMQRGPQLSREVYRTVPATKGYGSISRSTSMSEVEITSPTTAAPEHQSTSAAALAAAEHDPAVRSICLGLAVAYGGASGTMSGACLLLAKSGVELLELTISGQNQFDRWQSWFIIVVLLIAALLQLWYLNKSLRLASPPLVCPLAFCFYNTSSIALGLVYFDQLGSLSLTSILAVILGIGVLLTGVWIVSLHGAPSHAREKNNTPDEMQPLLGDQHDGETVGSPENLLQSPSSMSGSPSEAEEIERTEGLLANAAGIAGPHLPTPRSSKMPPGREEPSKSSFAAQAGRTATSNAGRHRRTRSASGSLMGGLGLHIPGLPLQPGPQPPAHDVVAAASALLLSAETAPTSNEAPRRRESSASSPRISLQSPPPTPQLSLLTSPRAKRRGLYASLMERGLSIGISPSSPGFHVASSFEVENRRRMESEQQQAVTDADPQPPTPVLPPESTQSPQSPARARAGSLQRRSFSETLSNKKTGTSSSRGKGPT